MTATLNPYLNFRGNAREAMEFYREVFDGRLAVSTFGEYQAPVNPDETELVMHADLEGPHGLRFMGADVPAGMAYEGGASIAMSLSGTSADDAELRGYFERLSSGGTVDEPLSTAPWGAVFGMLTDRFGIRWLVNIAPEQLG
ncbi:MAG: VOC family protein [Chloroflexota bacterium]